MLLELEMLLLEIHRNGVEIVGSGNAVVIAENGKKEDIF